MKRFLLSIAALGLGIPAAHADILPPNNLNLEDSLFGFAEGGITQEQFDKTIDYILTKYQPIAAKHNATFVVNRLWDDPTVNAGASRDGNQWQLWMFGGLARRPEVNPDAFSIVMCHEIGHLVAGFPHYFMTDISVEGEADYFATMSCVDLIWGEQLEENAKARADVTPEIQADCDKVYTDEANQNLCYRTMKASLALGDLMAYLQSQRDGVDVAVNTATPDISEVEATFEGHPKAQCRLDTYVAGALCNKPYHTDIIPTQADHVQYHCAIERQELHVRPRCWFKP
ncbi:MAG: hypothetical protein AB7T49_07845 [Oligoflexales bacterium]